MKAKLKTTGTKKLVRALKTESRRLERAEGQALLDEAHEIMGESKLMVPVDTGVLINSGAVLPPEKRPGGITVRLGYGTEYALPVHEDLHAFHEVGGPLYLEIPFNKRLSGWRKRIADKVRFYYNRSRGSR